MEIVNAIARKINLSFATELTGNENTFVPIDILDYIYAVLYSNKYRAKYKEFLKIDFTPRSLSFKHGNVSNIIRYWFRFARFAFNGKRKSHNEFSGLPDTRNQRNRGGQLQRKKVFINKQQYFENIPSEIWNYHIGGYQSAEKWLKDRKGRVLSFDSIERYQKIIAVLQMTIELQRQIDRTIEI